MYTFTYDMYHLSAHTRYTHVNAHAYVQGVKGLTFAQMDGGENEHSQVERLCHVFLCHLKALRSLQAWNTELEGRRY